MSANSSLAGRVVLVTGAGNGIGRAEAHAFHAEGATVVVTDIDQHAADVVVDELGDRSVAVQLDVADGDQWARVIDEVDEAHGPVRVLVNNAAIFTPAPILEGDVEAWRRVLDVNVVGTLHGIRSVIPGMRDAGGGSIVNTISTAGTRGLYGWSAYSTSKWGVRGLTRSAALELAAYGIRVNGVVPGIIKTPAMQSNGFPDALPEQAIPHAGAPEDVAAVAVFLASDAARNITGAEYFVDGGANAGVVPRNAPSSPL